MPYPCIEKYVKGTSASVKVGLRSRSRVIQLVLVEPVPLNLSVSKLDQALSHKWIITCKKCKQNYSKHLACDIREQTTGPKLPNIFQNAYILKFGDYIWKLNEIWILIQCTYTHRRIEKIIVVVVCTRSERETINITSSSY